MHDKDVVDVIDLTQDEMIGDDIFSVNVIIHDTKRTFVAKGK